MRGDTHKGSVNSEKAWLPGTKVYFWIRHSAQDLEIDSGYIMRATINDIVKLSDIPDDELPKHFTYTYMVMSKRHGYTYGELPRLTNFYLTYKECKEQVIALQVTELENLQKSIDKLKESLNELEG